MISSCLLIGYYGDGGFCQQVTTYMDRIADMPQIDYVGFYYTRAAHEIALAGTYLRQHGISIECAVSFINKKQYIKEVIESGIDSICIFSRYFTNISEYLEIVQFCKTIDFDIPIIIGGAFINNVFIKLSEREKEYVALMIGADAFILAFEYEQVLLELIKNNLQPIKNSDIPSIIYASQKTKTVNIKMNSSHSVKPIQCAVDWHHFHEMIKPITCVRTSISCPYDCAFCTVKNNDIPFQTLDDETVLNEVVQLVKLEKTDIVNFTDETLNVPKKRFIGLLEKMCNLFSNSLHWVSFIRCELITDEIAELMVKSGCCAVMLGLESGSNRMLNEMNKHTTVDKIERSLSILKKHNIITFAFFISGFPTETNESISETIKFINRVGPTFFKVNLWTCEWNTKVWRNRHKYQLEFKNGYWKHVTMDMKQAKQNMLRIHKEVDSSIDIGQIDFTYILQYIHAGKSIGDLARILRTINI